MNYNGKQVTEAIVRRLNDKDIRCYDSNIVAELKKLNTYELNQLLTFGDIDKWVSERNNKDKSSRSRQL